jgi:SAM-dependent methyltransferase
VRTERIKPSEEHKQTAEVMTATALREQDSPNRIRVSESPNLSCPLCGHQAFVLNDSHPGYEEPAKFSIAECCYCDLQFAHPMQSRESVYERIYEHAATLPGYSRYVWYADQVLRRKNPLQWLESQEEMYAFIGSELRRRCGTKSGRIVEIGSGLGYLTSALHQAGYDVRGMDVSERAVEAARRRFGDLFEVCDVTCMDTSARKADAIIMTEVIEHVPDPCALLRGIHSMLRPGGLALLTTPNKSAAPRDSYWCTDNPPVHFWWFSETSMCRMAQIAGLTVSFQQSATRELKPKFPSYFDAYGCQKAPSPLIRKMIERYPAAVFHAAALIRSRRQRAAQRLAGSERGATMRVILGHANCLRVD